MRPLRCLVLLAALASAISPLRAQEAGAAAADSVVVDAPTEAVLNGALRYLAGQQNGNGSWTTQRRKGEHPVAMTGYVLMCFLACGHLPERANTRGRSMRG